MFYCPAFLTSPCWGSSDSLGRLCVLLSLICVSCPAFGIEIMRIKAMVYTFLTPLPHWFGPGRRASLGHLDSHWLIVVCSNPVGFLPHHVTLSQTILSEPQSPSPTKLSNHLISAYQSWVLIKIIEVLVKIQILDAKTQFLLDYIKFPGSRLEL